MRTAAAPQRAAAASAAARADLCTWPRRAAGAGAAHRGACAWEQRAGVGAPVALCSRRAGAAFFAGCGAPSVAGACGGCARAAVGAVGGSARRGCARAAERSKATRAVDAAFGGALLRAGGPALVGRCSCVARRRGPRWRARGAHRCCMGLHRLVRRPRDRCQRNASLPIDGALGASEASGACQRSKTLKVPIIAKRTESPSSSALLTPFTSTPHSRCVRTLRAACARLRGAVASRKHVAPLMSATDRSSFSYGVQARQAFDARPRLRGLVGGSCRNGHPPGANSARRARKAASALWCFQKLGRLARARADRPRLRRAPRAHSPCARAGGGPRAHRATACAATAAFWKASPF